MQPNDIIAGLALLLILSASIGLRHCECDDETCVRAHQEHQSRAHQAQLRAIHDDYHSLPQPGCDYCNARDR